MVPLTGAGMPRTKDSDTSTRQLNAELHKLRQENNDLKRELQKGNRAGGLRDRWRQFIIVVCVGLAAALLVTGNILFWSARTLIDDKKYNAAVAPLIEQPEVQSAIAHYATAQIYQRVNIEQVIIDVLPPRAEIIAPALSGQVRNLTEQSLKRLLGNERIQSVWNESQQRAHQRLINFIRTSKGDGTIKLDDVYQQLTANLGQTKLSFLAGTQLPDSVGTIQVVDAEWLPAARNIINNIDTYRLWAVLLFLVLCGVALWLSKNRRKFIVSLGLVIALSMLISLISIRLVMASTVNHTVAVYQPAAQVVVDQLSQSLILQTRTLLLIGLFTSFLAWIGGPYKPARLLRKRFQILLEGHAHKAIWHKENRFTEWVGKYRRVLHWLTVAMIVLILIVVELSPRIIVSYMLLLLLAISLIELCAKPRTN